MSSFAAISPSRRPLVPSKDAVVHRQTWYAAHIHTRGSTSLSLRSKNESHQTTMERKGLAALLSKRGRTRPRTSPDRTQHAPMHGKRNSIHATLASPRATPQYPVHRTAFTTVTKVHRTGGSYSDTYDIRHRHRNRSSNSTSTSTQNDISSLLSARLKQRHQQPHNIPSLEEIVYQMDSMEEDTKRERTRKTTDNQLSFASSSDLERLHGSTSTLGPAPVQPPPPPPPPPGPPPPLAMAMNGGHYNNNNNLNYNYNNDNNNNNNNYNNNDNNNLHTSFSTSPASVADATPQVYSITTPEELKRRFYELEQERNAIFAQPEKPWQ